MQPLLKLRGSLWHPQLYFSITTSKSEWSKEWLLPEKSNHSRFWPATKTSLPRDKRSFKLIWTNNDEPQSTILIPNDTISQVQLLCRCLSHLTWTNSTSAGNWRRKVLMKAAERVINMGTRKHRRKVKYEYLTSTLLLSTPCKTTWPNRWITWKK